MERLWVMEITDKNLPINESYWKSMDEKQLNIFKEEIFQYYRNKGFPYYNLTVEQQKESIEKMDIYMNSNKNSRVIGLVKVLVLVLVVPYA